MLQIVRELLVRIGDIESRGSSVIASDTFSRWVDHYGERYSRTELAVVMEMERTNFSRQISGHSMSFDRCIKLADILNADPRVPLLSCGHINLEDVFDVVFDEVVADIPIVLLIEQVSESQKYLMQEIQMLNIE